METELNFDSMTERSGMMKSNWRLFRMWSFWRVQIGESECLGKQGWDYEIWLFSCFYNETVTEARKLGFLQGFFSFLCAFKLIHTCTNKVREAFFWARSNFLYRLELKWEGNIFQGAFILLYITQPNSKQNFTYWSRIKNLFILLAASKYYINDMMKMMITNQKQKTLRKGIFFTLSTAARPYLTTFYG